MPDRWLRRTPQEEFREQVRTLRRLHSTAMSGEEEPTKRLYARAQWFEEMQILMEQLAEQPTVWRGVQDAPTTAWQTVLGLLGTNSPLVWFVFGIIAFAWLAGLIKFPNPFGG